MKLTRLHIILLFALCSVLLAIGIIYLHLYQRVLDEGNTLIDQHCIAINPLIKQRKQAYIDGLRTIQASGSAGIEAYMSYQDQYEAAAKEYIKLETLWLGQLDAYLKRPDVQYILDSNIREAAKYQQQMFTAELEGTQAIVRMMDAPDTVTGEGTMDILTRTDENFRIAQEGYDLKYRQMRDGGKNIRDHFIRMPVNQCPEENSQFPDVEKELAP